MDQPLALPPRPDQETPVDYHRLRAEGIREIQRLAGPLWTDHNAHDPGITILEQLCYALTDLVYRAGYSIPDLLADPAKPGPAESLFTPAQILTTNPVTVDDWRKLIIDVDGVRNAWVEPVENPGPPLFHDPADNTLYLKTSTVTEAHGTPVPVRGLYRVLVDAPPKEESGISRNDLKKKIAARLLAHRNLGEDFEWSDPLPVQWIAIKADIEIGEVREPGELHQRILAALKDHVAPRVRFYTREEMLARGHTLDDIFAGPRLDHGFIDTDELRQSGRRAGLRGSDIIAVLMGIEEVETVHGLSLLDVSLGTTAAWYLPLDSERTPDLKLERSVIRLLRGRVVWAPSEDTVSPDQEQRAGQERTAPALVDQAVPAGRPRHIERYYSIQNQLPEAFGIGPAGLPANVALARRAQAKQLAAYLMFFDQVLASSFSQLAHARDLVSFAAVEDADRTYFPQLPAKVPRGCEVLDHEMDAKMLQEMTPAPPARAQRFLAHLLARFGEEFQDLALVRDAGQRLKVQRAFLREYPDVSGGRGRAFDYTQASWGEAHAGNVSGLEKRVAAKLCLTNYFRRSLAGLAPEGAGGFHLVEHILLRPRREDLEQWTVPGDLGWRPPALLAQPGRVDPYSSQLTFVFPAWITAFQYHPPPETPGEFALFIEKTVREETPAHLSVRVLWLDQSRMGQFEAAYQEWLGLMIAPA